MAEHIKKAIAVIDQEAEESRDANIKQIAQVLIEAVSLRDDIALSYLQGSQKISGAFAKVREAARKTGGAVSDEDAYKIMFEHLGMQGLRVRTKLVVVEDERPAQAKPARLNLADFLS